jgi:O-methyltransferase
MIKQFLKRAARATGFEVRRPPRTTDHVPPIPDAALYQPVYSPWRSPAFTAECAPIAPYTLVSDDRCYVLASLVTQASRLEGEAWECGVYRGGTAMPLAEKLSAAKRTLRLFDTFEGMPEADAGRDWHRERLCVR